MAHNTDKVGFPSVPIRQGMVLKLEARAVSTDAEVAGVTASAWAIYGFNDGVGVGFDVVPLLTPLELDQQAP